MRRLAYAASIALGAAVVAGACGGHTMISPSPGNGGNGGNQQPPPNSLPVIDSITVQGGRLKEPPNFADATEVINVTAKVHDEETPVEQLELQWSATVGTVDGTGPSVRWRAPAAVTAPYDVIISLKVVEHYGQPGGPAVFSHDVTGEAKLSLHDSVREVSDMAKQFLLDFSNTDLHDADYIMRNFGSGTRCPEPREVTDERVDVINNFTNYKIQKYTIYEPVTTVNFKSTCPVYGNLGDACSVVRAFWDSIRLKDGARGTTDGDDILAAAYSGPEERWWLCSSRYYVHSLTGVLRSIR